MNIFSGIYNDTDIDDKEYTLEVDDVYIFEDILKMIYGFDIFIYSDTLMRYDIDDNIIDILHLYVKEQLRKGDTLENILEI